MTAKRLLVGAVMAAVAMLVAATTVAARPGDPIWLRAPGHFAYCEFDLRSTILCFSTASGRWVRVSRIYEGSALLPALSSSAGCKALDSGSSPTDRSESSEASRLSTHGGSAKALAGLASLITSAAHQAAGKDIRRLTRLVTSSLRGRCLDPPPPLSLGRGHGVAWVGATPGVMASIDSPKP
jgi:hypothetical protein